MNLISPDSSEIAVVHQDKYDWSRLRKTLRVGKRPGPTMWWVTKCQALLRAAQRPGLRPVRRGAPLVSEHMAENFQDDAAHSRCAPSRPGTGGPAQ